MSGGDIYSVVSPPCGDARIFYDPFGVALSSLILVAWACYIQWIKS